jgi:hypothetical protein
VTPVRLAAAIALAAGIAAAPAAAAPPAVQLTADRIAPVTSAPASAQAAVTREGAARIARAFIVRRFGQPARVTWAGREDDFGARWEIEVTRRDGAEFDVYVNARGRVVRVIRDRSTGPTRAPANPSPTTVTEARARTIALRVIEDRYGQPARVTDAGPEDDFGARWEIEVTRRDGAEFDVYVTARGTVVRVVRTISGG